MLPKQRLNIYDPKKVAGTFFWQPGKHPAEALENGF
jgi:hypothetical protein